ncbi:MAG: ribosomal protein S5 [Parcubacteria bacterium C7867-006]|nr:MAG: ribosomal protein S5 [Parcubacteria bacterium C7867-006]
MEPIVTKTEEVIAETLPVETASPAQDKQGREFKKNSRKGAPRREARVKPEFDQKIIDIRRVTRVVTGGRRFSFSVSVVIGDRKGRVGVGMGKAGDTPVAIDKAVRDARKNMIKVNLTKNSSVPHEADAKYSSSRILIMRAPGKGVLAGSSVRVVLELAGIKEVSAKIFSRSKNKINNAKAAIKALSKMKAVK